MYQSYMEGYSNTVILDCNRGSSEEGKTHNTETSIWTNKVGVGVNLNQGDQVSVHSGFISRRGCGADTMEFTGKATGKQISLKKLTKKEYQKNINAIDYFGINVPNPNYAEVPQVYGCEQYVETTEKYDVKDNEAHFNISYYKTANGEGYYHLPRRFDAWKDKFHNDTAAGPGNEANPGERPSYWPFLFSAWDKRKSAATGGWAIAGGVPLHQDCYKNGNCASADFPVGSANIVLEDNYYKFCYSNRLRRCRADVAFYQEGSDNTSSDGGSTVPGAPLAERDRLSMIWKKKNDGARYTIYVKEISYFSERNPKKWFYPKVDKIGQLDRGDDEDIDNLTSSRNDYHSEDPAQDQQIFAEYRDPAQSEYIKYTETKSISLTPGNFSPSNVATELTNQLNLTDHPKYVVGVVQDGLWPASTTDPPMTPGIRSTTHGDLTNNVINDAYDTNYFVGKQSIVSTTTDSTCFKTFNTATAVSVEEKAYLDFGQATQSLIEGQATFHYGDAEAAVNYGSAYQFIGVKRPELFEAGRKVAKELGYRVVGANTDGAAREGAFNWATQKPYTADTNSVPHKAAGNHHSQWSWKQMINPFISREISYTERDTAIVQTSYNWNETNLNALKDFFDVQGKYPELFEGVQFPTGSKNGKLPSPFPTATYKDGVTIHNSRFFHVAGLDGAYGNAENWCNTLGTDYIWANDQTDVEVPSRSGSNALFFYFDEARSEVASGGEGQPDGSEDENLYYGLFCKKSYHNPYSDVVEDIIAITTAKIGGLSYENYEDYTEDGDGVATRGHISRGITRTIGFDCHFSAYGTSCINLYAGHLSGSVTDITKSTVAEQSVPIGTQAVDAMGGRQADIRPLYQYLSQRYLGAENPQLSFDPQSSKFNFQELHTPERVGNIVNAGALATIPIVSDTNDKVYFVNKRLLMKEYAPDMFPYAALVASKVGAQEESSTTWSTYMNQNITGWSIMDADCGVFIEDFGFNEDQLASSSPYKTLIKEDWKDTLWDMLGFTYEQFHTTFAKQQLTRQTRINNTITTDTIGKPTTNADVEPSDIGQYNTNIYGAQLRTNQIPAIFGEKWVASPYGSGWNEKINGYFPSATVIQQSAQISAANLPTKMVQPYFLIQSSIIADTAYLGSEDSGQALNVIAVVPKSSADGDFFFSGEGQTQFTITNPKTITSIKTTIMNPDGSPAKLSADSSVIYKIIKKSGAQLGVAQQMMEKTKPKKK
jgi:hypothetical protein